MRHRSARRRWLRWAAGSLLALVVIIVAVVVAAVRLQTSPPPLALPGTAATAPTGPLDGTWRVTTGSAAGFRVRESLLGLGNDVVGRTGRVTGTAVLAGDKLARATFQIGLDAITVDGKARQPQLMKSLDTDAFPVATVTLTRPALVPALFSSGGTVTLSAPATLSLDGATRPVTVRLSARRDGTMIQAAGSIPVAFASFGIDRPHGYGVFGSLAAHGSAEFLLLLAQS